MTSPSSTRQRLIHAAFDLFTTQGVTETTTRQIADLAGVNEVTLFRQFGNKHGLLLAMIQESAALSQLEKLLRQEAAQTSNAQQSLKNYARNRLDELAQIPEFLRSLVGEAGQYPTENRQALGRSLAQGNQWVAQYLETAVQQGQLQLDLSAAKIAGLLTSLLLGYMVVELTSESHHLWADQDDFLDSLVTLFLAGAVSPRSAVDGLTAPPTSFEPNFHAPDGEAVVDLPATIVHAILRQAKKMGARDYALAYVLFAAGLSSAEIVGLHRSDHICDARQHLLQVVRKTTRQVPVNQRILDKRYGSYMRNPLTQWLKSRKDAVPALFINEAGQPLSEPDVRSRWQLWVTEIFPPGAPLPTIEQAQQTWCIDLLMRGIDLENLSILTGWSLNHLQPYTRRAREKAALEQVLQLDTAAKRATKTN
jgi:AcrR family transcriptional regulator